MPNSLLQNDLAVQSQPYVNIAAYHFVTLDRLPERREALRELCFSENLKGTILLAEEGINLFIAGMREGIDRLVNFIRQDSALADLEIKESFSKDQPFERMLVKIKSEIIAFGIDGIDPRRRTSPKMSAQELKEALAQNEDLILLDVRNDYEVNVGTFDNAVPVGVDNFRDFPEAIERLPEEWKERPVVMFCTGGIRCEKAGPYMQKAGFKNIFQLNGGILKYFEEVGGEHYHGDCFVFDKRVALDPQLNETDLEQCYACLHPLTVEDQKSPVYDPPHACPHCFKTQEQKKAERLAQRMARLKEVVNPLPGSIPYDNARPLNVPLRFAGLSLFDFLNQHHPHLGAEYWQQQIEEERIRKDGQPVPADRVVQAGEQFAHLQPATVEPDVNANIEILFEDEAIVVANKPAPLPTHPSGRFNRNTLQWILNETYAPMRLRPAHRLDANTTGLVVFSKTRSVSAKLQPQFSEGTVEKRYLARLQGIVPWEETVCEEAISREPTACGGRSVQADGLASRTRFKRLQTFADGTSLVEAIPETGRTNQIRIHAWSLGFPIQGDPLYLPEGKMGGEQTQSSGEVMCLHAAELRFRHPQTATSVAFTAPSPEWAESVESKNP